MFFIHMCQLQTGHYNRIFHRAGQQSVKICKMYYSTHGRIGKMESTFCTSIPYIIYIGLEQLTPD